MTDGLSFVRAGYGHAADHWASGAELAYGPMAAALLDAAPVPLAGLTVADVGAGTGAVSRQALAAGATPIAVDAVLAMLAHRAGERPPAAVADVLRLPFRDRAVDGAAAAFVLNHLAEPVSALVELRRIVRPGGFVLASVFDTSDRPPAKEAIDGALERAGWQRPDWYQHLKSVDSQLGSADAMEAAARNAGFDEIVATEQRVDTGVTDPREIVRFRFSQPHLTGFVETLSADERRRVTEECVSAVEATGTGLSPGVVLLAATVPRDSDR
jgi:ubiquinone/menaquinone biosynthesis C-methylase UbiE